jgi:hypothetical protein
LSGQSALRRQKFGDPDEQPSTIRQEGVVRRDRGQATWRYSPPSRQWQDVAMLRSEPGFEPVVNRRRVLTGGVALAALAIAMPACSSPPAPPAVDEFEAQLALARHDSELATAAAAGASQAVSAALTQVAAERTRHAQALTTEIARLAVNPTSTAAGTTSPTTTASAAATPPPPVADVVTSLRASADSAGKLASTSSGYRAGLLGSIAASCTASYSVALASGAAAS